MDGSARTGPKSAGLPSPQLARPFANPEKRLSMRPATARCQLPLLTVLTTRLHCPEMAKAANSTWAWRPAATSRTAHATTATFVIGLLGARRDALIPGLCPGCQLLHIPIFIDEHAPWASVGELANAISIAVAAGARIINLSSAILGDDLRNDPELAAALNYAELKSAVCCGGCRQPGSLGHGPASIAFRYGSRCRGDAGLGLLPDSNFGPVILRRGVAALGRNLPGYAPGGGTTAMSGTKRLQPRLPVALWRRSGRRFPARPPLRFAPRSYA